MLHSEFCHCVGSCDDFFYCLFRSDGESDEESEKEVEEESEEEESENDYETRTAQASMCTNCAYVDVVCGCACAHMCMCDYKFYKCIAPYHMAC